jgi:predicted methyltransferase
VADPLPPRLISQADAFYTNPPWGASNGGESVIAFVRRGIESLGASGLAAVVVANEPKLRWTQIVLDRTRIALLREGFVIEKLGDKRCHYHLDDDPNLRSCTLIARRVKKASKKVMSRKLNPRSSETSMAAAII